MQVSSIAELDTHAVIGGGKAEAFGMSESAEFFTVLSDTLYRDKIRAVAREVICNAWDAHIMVGATDRPIEITLTDQELIIRDHGPGIAPERMRPIYCIYGASTKVKDENQTGGFGLGSKAPFAYSDHFSVVSAHEGLRTVYAVSRGGAETDGKPDMRAMVQTPTKNSGITVSIPIRSRDDRLRFESHITAVVKQGGIKALLNEQEMFTFDYTEARKRGYALCGQSADLRESQVYVLYGTVLYPVSGTNSDLAHAVNSISNYKDHGDKFILIAKPNTVGVTPSRESLSYSDRTVATILGLITNIKKSVEGHGRKAVKEIIKGRLKEAKRYEIRSDIINSGSRISTRGEVVTDAKALAKIAASGNMDAFTTALQRHKIVMDEMAKKYRDDRRFFRRNRHTMFRNRSYYGQYAVSSERDQFLNESRLVRRLIAKFDLFGSAFVSHWDEIQGRKLIPLEEFNHFGAVNQRLIFAPTQRDGFKAAREYHALAKDEPGYERKLTLVIINRRLSPETLDKIRDAAKHWKIDIETTNFAKPIRRKRADIGIYYSLRDVKENKDGYVHKIDEIKTLLKANYYMPMRGGLDRLEMDKSLFQVRDKILERYGDVALAMSSKTEAKLKAAGAKNIYDALFADLQKANNSREAQIASMMQHDGFIQNPHWHSPGRLINELCHKDMKFVTFFFGVKPSKGTALEDAKFLMSALGGNRNSGRVSRHNNSVSQEMDRTYAEAKKTFAHLILDRDQSEKVFAWLKPLTGMGVSQRGDTSKDDLMTILKFLKRTFSVKSTPNNDNATLEEAKEAA
jgi:hypothetical protein